MNFAEMFYTAFFVAVFNFSLKSKKKYDIIKAALYKANAVLLENSIAFNDAAQMLFKTAWNLVPGAALFETDSDQEIRRVLKMQGGT